MTYLEGHVLNESQCQPQLVGHQTERGLVDHLVQDHQVMVLGLVFRALEVVVQVVFELALLLVDVGEVDEEARAHVALHSFDLVVRGRSVAAAEQVAVLQQASAADLLGIFGSYEFLVQVIEGFLEVAKHGLGHDGGVKVVRDGGCIGFVALVVEEQGVQDHVKGVHAELVLTPHCMHKLELDSFGPIVA